MQQTQITDFKGLVNLDKKIVPQLTNYLKEKEIRLSKELLRLAKNYFQNEIKASEPALLSSEVKLSEGTEEFVRALRPTQRTLSNEKIEKESVTELVEEVNSLLWDYTEALEGCVVELFQQISQVSVDKWHLTIFEVISQIRDLLAMRIEDLVWAVRRLKEPLNEFCNFSSKEPVPFWKRWNLLSLDSDLLKNLKKSQQFLQEQYEEFCQRHEQFKELSRQVEDFLQKMKRFAILARLDLPEQNFYVDVYRLLKMVELNDNTKTVLKEETVRSLKYLASVDSVHRLFHLYQQELKQALFACSYEYKFLTNEKDSPYYEELLNRLKEKAKEYRVENEMLLQTIRSYREFILVNDSNPYVSSQWGFAERTVGPEPASATKLLDLAYATEQVTAFYLSFEQSLEIDSDEYFADKKEINGQVEKLLHEMKQPLISYDLMRNRAERLLNELQDYDELGSPDLNVVDAIETALNQAIQVDWKYHVLHEFSQFHTIYHLHVGLRPRPSDPAHAFRIERFELFFHQIEGWVKKGDLFTHIHEVELDINDIKTYLQDFLASVQRLVKEKPSQAIKEYGEALLRYAQQLLQYRYLFGKFFSALTKSGLDGEQLRIQFLFVDQYFESIDHLIDASYDKF